MSRKITNKICSDCLWWDRENAHGEQKDKAKCRVQPPSITPAYKAGESSWDWPTTNAKDWCGAFAAAEALGGDQS